MTSHSWLTNKQSLQDFVGLFCACRTQKRLNLQELSIYWYREYNFNWFSIVTISQNYVCVIMVFFFQPTVNRTKAATHCSNCTLCEGMDGWTNSCDFLKKNYYYCHLCEQQPLMLCSGKIFVCWPFSYMLPDMLFTVGKCKVLARLALLQRKPRKRGKDDATKVAVIG